jgi:GT2 family glycosyltransferase
MGDVPEKVDWVSGASFIVRREVFEWVGLMDERYFLYFEEVDFCFAAQRAGWECWYIPGSRVMHIAGAATGVTVRTDKPRRVPAYWFESRRRFYTKNYGTVHAAAADLAYIVGHATWRVRRRLQNKPDTDPESFLQDFVKHSSLSPKARRR